MNVVYSSSDSYAPIAGVSIMSLLHNNTDADEINIYMIDNNISDENKKRFENMVDKFGRNIVFILYLSTMMIPITVRLIPSYNLCRNLNMLDTYMGMILPQVAWSITFGTFLMRQFYMGIPKQLDEAAKIDGAGPVRAFFSITLPNIMKTILSLSIFFTMWRLTSFDLVYAMTSGGPGDSTSLLAYRIMQEAFTNLNLGYASAIAVCLFIVMTILSFIQLRAIKKFD